MKLTNKCCNLWYKMHCNLTLDPTYIGKRVLKLEYLESIQRMKYSTDSPPRPARVVKACVWLELLPRFRYSNLTKHNSMNGLPGCIPLRKLYCHRLARAARLNMCHKKKKEIFYRDTNKSSKDDFINFWRNLITLLKNVRPYEIT